MVKSSDERMRWVKAPIFTPFIVYLVSFILPALVMTMPALLLNWNTDYQSAHLYLIGTAGQLLMDIPAAILLMRLRHNNMIGIETEHRTRDRVMSFVVGIICAVVLAALRFLVNGKLIGGRFMGGVPAFTQSLDLARPWNILAASMALLSYGPGEALFVVYLILAFDKAAGDPHSVLSRGVIITSILWALPHVFNVFYFGINALPNVVIMFFIGIGMGILLKKTRSSLGPVIFWTLVNGTSA